MSSVNIITGIMQRVAKFLGRAALSEVVGQEVENMVTKKQHPLLVQNPIPMHTDNYGYKMLLCVLITLILFIGAFTMIKLPQRNAERRPDE